MEAYRISNKRYASRLTCSGKPNRWNKERQSVIYAGSSRSLSTLELLVHRNSIKPHAIYQVMVISIADDENLYDQLLIKDLPPDWRMIKAIPNLQELGSKWYLSKRSLILKVPSVVIMHEYNLIINTDHPDFKKKVKLVRIEDYFWDERLQAAKS